MTEGDSVTLNIDLTEIHEDDNILWIYGGKTCIIAEINAKYGLFFTREDVPDGRFRNRLKLDNQTGSLTITNITTQHAGLYEVNGAKGSLKAFSVSVYGE